MGTIKIIKASAGSGKTYNLARTYIANLIGEPTGTTVTVGGKEYEQYTLRKSFNNHRHLLAITFTNKATNEMKVRIIRQLHGLSQGKGDYINDFDIMFGNNRLEDVQDAAEKALSSILFDYANFNVSTIDSFFQRVLRNFARELDYDYNYEVQIDEDYATGVAVHDFLLELGSANSKQTAINNWVRDFISHNITNNKDWNFFGKSGDLESFAGNIYKEFFREHKDEIITYLDDIGNGSKASKVERFKQKIIRARNKHQEDFEAEIAKYHNFFSSRNINGSDLKKTVVAKFYDGTFTEFSNSEEKTLRNYATMTDALSSKVILAKAKKKVNKNECDDAAFQNLVQATIYNYDQFLIYDSILKNIWNLGLLGKINEKLEQYRKDSNIILIADTNDLIGKALLSGAYFIYEHVGIQFNNYMIDEFQDTSKKQYSNFLPLLEETIARGEDNLVIGDEKQSIYRFRNSDPSLLRDEIEKDFAGRVDVSPLDTNYRSYKAIVEFNNELFTALINDLDKNAYPSLVKTYNNITQVVHKNDTQGLVEVNFVPNVGRENQTRKAILKTLPSLINSMLSRGYRMGDIAVLVSSNEHGKEVIAEIMRYNESLSADDALRPINVISAESLMLENSPSVKLILSALRFLEVTQYHLPENNDEALSEEFAKFLENRINEQRYYKVLHDFMARIQTADATSQPGEILHDCVEEDYADNNSIKNDKRKQLKKYADTTQDLMPDKNAQLSNLVNVVDKIIAKYILSDSTTELENSYIMAFVDVVHNFSRRHNGGTIAEFLQYWDMNSDKLTLGSSNSIDAVNVMTIHKSKGLEFKCVILPFANWTLDKMDDIFWIEKSEFLNNLGSLVEIKDIDTDIVPPLVPVDSSRLKTTGLFAKVFNDECEKCIIDNINKLYVALTRPKEELHVFVNINKDTDPTGAKPVEEVNKTADLLLKFLPRMTINGEMMGREERDLNTCYASGDEAHNSGSEDTLHAYTYHYGESRNAGTEKKEESNVLPVKDYWVSSEVLPVHVSMPGSNGTLRDEGLKMHFMFGMIRSERDFDKAFNFAKNNGLLSDNVYWTEEKVKELLESIKASEQLMAWFDDDNICYNERNISFEHHDTIDHRRPDRIVKRSNGEMIVVDYKFGPSHAPETIAKHKKQVQEYLILLRQLVETKIKGYVWYTRSGEIVEVEQ